MSTTYLRAATLVVKDVKATTARYIKWLDYLLVEEGTVAPSLAELWLSPGSTGKNYTVLRPSSHASVFLRFVEGDDVPDYQPMRTYGWAATELCVKDVETVNERLKSSPFQIIGPPKPLDGFPTVKPMQIRGPDNEIVYLTEILVGGSDSGLPTAESLIDRPFIMVLACSNIRESISWIEKTFELPVSTPVKINYSMLSAAFGMDLDEKHELCIVQGAGETFLELDQYPEAARARSRNNDTLPPGVAITTMIFPDFHRLEEEWAVPPKIYEGAIYEGRRAGILKTPDGALLEVVESSTQ